MKRPRKCRPKIGDFVAVYWNDASNWHDELNSRGRESGLVEAVSLGVVVRTDRREIHVAQSRFKHSDNSYSFNEVQCIPRSQVTRINIRKRNQKE